MRFGCGLGINKHVRRGSTSTSLTITSITNDGSGNITAAFSGTGTAYWAMFANGTAAQTGSIVKAHTGALLWSTSGVAITAGTVGPLTIDDSTLTAGTTYSFQIVGEDGAGLMATASAVNYTKAGSPTFKASTVAANSNTTSMTVTLPTNAAGDSIILAVEHLSSQPITTPSGYTAVYQTIARHADAPLIDIYRKVSSGSESNPAIAFTSGTGYATATALTYSGISGVGQMDRNYQYSGLTMSSQTVTASANSLILTFFANSYGYVDYTITVTGTGSTTRAVANGLGYQGFLVAAEHGPVSAGATTARTGTVTTSGMEWNTATLELLA